MKFWMAGLAIAAASTMAHGAGHTMMVFQDPYCGCCGEWVQYMKDNGFQIQTIQTRNMGQVKQKLGVPAELSSCHTAVLTETGQLVEGHVPVNVVEKMMADSTVKGVAAPGMPHNAPGLNLTCTITTTSTEALRTSVGRPVGKLVS